MGDSTTQENFLEMLVRYLHFACYCIVYTYWSMMTFFIDTLCLKEIFRLNARDNCQKNDLSSSHAPQTKNKRQG